MFGYKWGRRDTYDSGALSDAMIDFNLRRYGDIANAPWWPEYGDRPRVLDVGCGAGIGAMSIFGHRLSQLEYWGVDISDAYKVAETRFAEHGLSGTFQHGDMTDLDVPLNAFDVILAEGVLHHTDDTENAFHRVMRHLAPGGRVLAYVYRKKGPIREFTDDYIRDQISGLSPEEAWKALAPLTQLGITLGQADLEIDIPEPIEILGIPAGKLNLQRFFYWHIFKAYYRPDWKFEEMQHVNFDWFAPKNAHRHTKEEIEKWCADAGLTIERLDEEEPAGYTVIARRG
ncbi:methyltransferase domain protein [Bordetella bronchiseptica GA96-01]|nr:class I SAM-dependent methyltransferase [Bordetella bronchiseptica]KDC33441.1 methyltransferase domain protein [Bordetella bronchiseptica GA96-01]